MEQNGIRDRIHLSKETADLVTKAGKGKWLVPREDKIVAKGKGKPMRECSNHSRIAFLNLLFRM
jgi:hypothetical protein